MQNSVVQVTNLTKHFKDFVAVDNLSFNVYDKDVYGFLGQNGAGKSTTMRMLINLIHPTSGEIFINNKNLKTNRRESLSQIGAIIERPDMYKYLSAYENVRIFATLSGKKITKSQIIDQLAAVGLQEVVNKKAGQFSQGMKQRLGLATALIHNPNIIILDEPTNGLDPQGIADMRLLIKKLSSELGKTVIVSSHLLSEIQQVSNRMLVIHKGKKLVEGEVSQLLNPLIVTVALQTNNNDLLQKFCNDKNIKIFIEDDIYKITVAKKDIPQLLNEMYQFGVGVESVIPQNSLEDYFLKLTNSEKE